LKEREKKI